MTVGVKECSKENEDFSQAAVFDFQEVVQFSNNYMYIHALYTTMTFKVLSSLMYTGVTHNLHSCRY